MYKPLENFKEAQKLSFINIYGEKGKEFDPRPKLPKFVRDRITYFDRYAEDGLNPIGLVNSVLALDPKIKDEFELGGTWLPASDEFKTWLGQLQTRQIEVMLATIYGCRPMDDELSSDD